MNNDLKDTYDLLRKNPRQAVILALAGVVIALGSMFLTGYFGELGRRTAQTNDSTLDAEGRQSVTMTSIRSLLESINPEILQKIDGGTNTIKVMLGQRHLNAIISMTSHKQSAQFLEFVQDGGYQVGATHDFPNHIYDQTTETIFYGGTIHPKDALKK